MIHLKLRQQGVKINHKRTERIYNQQGLKLNRRKRRAKIACEERVPVELPAEPIHIHVEKDPAYAKIWISPLRLQYSRGFNNSQISKILTLVE